MRNRTNGVRQEINQETKGGNLERMTGLAPGPSEDGRIKKATDSGVGLLEGVSGLVVNCVKLAVVVFVLWLVCRVLIRLWRELDPVL